MQALQSSSIRKERYQEKNRRGIKIRLHQTVFRCRIKKVDGSYVNAWGWGLYRFTNKIRSYALPRIYIIKNETTRTSKKSEIKDDAPHRTIMYFK